MAFYTVVIVFVAYLCVFAFGMRTTVIGSAMEPGLHSGQVVLVNRMSYRIKAPKRNDIIVFLPNGNQNSHYYIKRVIGLPGERIIIKNGFVFIDDEPFSENDKYDKMRDAGIAKQEITLGPNEYFVLGDNRNNSEDSRSGNIGAVKAETIYGKAWFKCKNGKETFGLVQ